MSSFDESRHPRNRGKFTAVSHGEPEVSIGGGFDARYWGLPTYRPGSWVFGSRMCAETVAGSVVDGPLTVSAAAPESARAFELFAADAAAHGTTEGDDFGAGLDEGLRALTRSDPDTSRETMLEAMTSGPLPRPRLVGWQLNMRNAQTSAAYRGQLAAGVLLSGAGEWWGITENLDLAVNGPAEDAPFPRTWSSILD